MALEEIRHLLDRRRQGQNAEGQGTTAGRVMVCLSSRSPSAHVLLRKGARLADRLYSPWYAVYIKTPREDLSRVDAATQRRIADTLALAHQLGAVPLNYAGADFASAVAAFVHEYAITHIVLGRTLRPWYRALVRPVAARPPAPRRPRRRCDCRGHHLKPLAAWRQAASGRGEITSCRRGFP